MKEAFNLRALIRSVLDGSTEPDPRQLAELVARKTPTEQQHEAYLQALRPLLVNEATLMRHRGDGGHDVDEAHPQPDLNAPMPRVGPSRWAGIRGRHCVDGVWKLAEDLTAEDCEWLSADCTNRATALWTRATTWKNLAARMRAEGVQRLEELGADALEEAA